MTEAEIEEMAEEDIVAIATEAEAHKEAADIIEAVAQAEVEADKLL